MAIHRTIHARNMDGLIYCICIFSLVIIASGQVCYEQNQRSRTTVGSRTEAYFVYYGFQCGWLNWRRCTGQRRLYRLSYYSTTVTYYVSNAVCCTGYTGTVATGCTPECRNPECVQGQGICTAPEVCTCNSGWTGSGCANAIIDCGNLSPPSNGSVDTSAGTLLNAVAQYSCDSEYILVNDSERTCVSTGPTTGSWSGSAPMCVVIDCGSLPDIPNGVVTVNDTSLNSTAQYSCNDGYMLLGSAVRTCESTEMWSGSEPACTRPIEVDLDVERTSVTGNITCHNTSLASLSCELRKKNGDVVQTVPCTCDSSFTFSGLAAGKGYRAVVIASAGGAASETEAFAYTCRASPFCGTYIKDYSIDKNDLRVSFAPACDTTRFRCEVDFGGYSDCTSPFKHQLKPGRHIFKVQPRQCGQSRRAIKLQFELAADGTMINPTIAGTGPA